MIEKWRNKMDKRKSCAALLTDLSKAFDCIVHDVLIAKLEAYGFSHEALKVMQNYLTDRKNRTRVNNSFSDFIHLHALARISKYMTKDKLRTIMNAFFSSQFAYCPLIWTFHNQTLNSRIYKL